MLNIALTFGLEYMKKLIIFLNEINSGSSMYKHLTEPSYYKISFPYGSI